MSQTNDGGPAFPHLDLYTGAGNSQPTPTQYNGMSLRDYFASHASDSDVKRWMEIYSLNGTPITEEEAKYAYADVMLAERQKERE